MPPRQAREGPPLQGLREMRAQNGSPLSRRSSTNPLTYSPVYVYFHIYIYTHTHTNICICIHKHICAYIYIMKETCYEVLTASLTSPAQMYACIDMYEHTCMYTYVNMCVSHMCVYIYIYTYM